MAVKQYNRVTNARPLSSREPAVFADVIATRTPGIFHCRVIETAPGGEVIRQAEHRLKAADSRTAGVAALWLFNHSCRFPCSGFFAWR